jgi:hypothetical protein
MQTDHAPPPTFVMQEAGQEPPPEPAPAADVEAAVAAATAAVQRPAAGEVTDGDVMSALLERGSVTQEQLVQALALHSMAAAQAVSKAGAGESAGIN